MSGQWHKLHNATKAQTDSYRDVTEMLHYFMHAVTLDPILAIVLLIILGDFVIRKTWKVTIPRKRACGNAKLGKFLLRASDTVTGDLHDFIFLFTLRAIHSQRGHHHRTGHVSPVQPLIRAHPSFGRHTLYMVCSAGASVVAAGASATAPSTRPRSRGSGRRLGGAGASVPPQWRASAPPAHGPL